MDNTHSTIFHYSIGDNLKDVIEQILVKGSKKQIASVINTINSYAESPLAEAAKNGKLEYVELLLKHGAEV
jgi:ankyrin repeat protein